MMCISVVQIEFIYLSIEKIAKEKKKFKANIKGRKR